MVITIIVLLILASITISTLFGEHGIIQKATNAKYETKKAEYKELIELIIIEKQTEEWENPTQIKPFIEIVKDAIEEKDWVTPPVGVCDDDLNEVTDFEDGTKLIVETVDEYEIIVSIDNNSKTGFVETVSKGLSEKWTVEFDINDGNGTTPEKIQVRKGWSITLPIGDGLTKPEYKMVGWSETQNGEALQGSKYTPKGNITLYAVWNEDTVTVRLNGNGSSSGDILKNVIRGRDLVLDFSFERNGYDFIGWSTQTNGSVQYSKGQTIKVNEDITLYAQWEGKISISLSVTNANKVATTELTSGTQLNVAVTSLASEISNLNIRIGNITVYNNSESGNTLNKSLTIDSLINLTQLTSFQTYTITATGTNKDGKTATATKTGITDYTIKTINDLKSFANMVNSGNDFSGKKVYLLNDLNATGYTIEPIGTSTGGTFRRNF